MTEIHMYRLNLRLIMHDMFVPRNACEQILYILFCFENVDCNLFYVIWRFTEREGAHTTTAF